MTVPEPAPTAWPRPTSGQWLLAAALVALIVLLGLDSRRERRLPDFQRADDSAATQAAFRAWLEPRIRGVNEAIAAQRATLEQLAEQARAGMAPSARDRQWIERMGRQYRLPSTGGAFPASDWFSEMQLRVDTIPPQLVVAQAALESGWGSSRIARRGNNLFGITCTRPGCGLIPDQRTTALRYEFTRYRSPTDSLRAYFDLLNGHPAYAPFRELRAQQRAGSGELDASLLAAGLRAYSELGDEYIERIRKLIAQL